MTVKNKYTLDYQPDTNIPSGVFPYIKMIVMRNPVFWVLMFLSDIIHGIRYPVSYLLVGIIIDMIIAQNNSGTIPSEAWGYVGLMFAVLFIGELVHAWPHYFFFDWIKRARAQLRADMFAYTLGHSYTYFQNQFAGALARKVSEGVERAVNNLGAQIRWEIFLPLVAMTTSGAIIFEVHWVYGLLIFLFILSVTIPVIMKLKKFRKKSEIFADARSVVTGQIVDSLTNITAVKSFAQRQTEMDAHRKAAEAEMKAWHKMLRVFLMLDNYRRACLVLFGGGMMVACLLGWQEGIISAGEIATIMGITMHFVAYVWSISFGIIHVTESFGYINDSLNTLIKPVEIQDRENAAALNVTSGEIKFERACFHYRSEPVFKDLDLTFEPGKRYGLVGPSGAGKSTLINLIQRFFDVQSGQILIDGQDIAAVTQASLRQNIAVIPQDTALFHRSLMDNIRYGRQEASDAEVIEAARRAHAEEFIAQLPEGYDTMVGERGVKLSGGQRQRIAIARAILKDAPILILDEATSALDSESEKFIQDSLADLMEGKTVIAIAHRLSTIAHLDQLIVMNEGQIVEQGSHEELLTQNGLYAKLWAMQSGGFLGE